MNNAESNVKTYACKKATRISSTSINNTIGIETEEIHICLKIKIKLTRLKTTMCPAVIFAKRRIINANGFENNPIISTGIIIGESQKGTPGVAKICFQYVFVPLN